MQFNLKYNIDRQPTQRYAVKVLLWCLTAGLLCSAGYAAEGNYPALRDSIDPQFQAAFEKALDKHFGQDIRDLAKAGKVGIVLADITDPYKPKVAEVNGDITMYAASLPKIAIVLGVFVEMERGNIKMNDETRKLLIATVRKSSNKAATKLLNRIGIENLAEILQSDRYRLYDPKYGGGLWVGRDYGGGPVWKRDPINNISHGASAMQAARFYYMGATGRLVAPQYQDDLVEVFSKPGITHKFVKGLKEAEPEAEVYRKSGTWKQFHADSGIITEKDREYILVGLVEHEEGGEGLVELISVVEEFLDSSEGR
ncbi:MAG: serine hydrolase [Desulfobacterales bacterium]|nr:MAG: serine hydrolase [Desulfobacterales bacterium]